LKEVWIVLSYILLYVLCKTLKVQHFNRFWLCLCSILFFYKTISAKWPTCQESGSHDLYITWYIYNNITFYIPVVLQTYTCVVEKYCLPIFLCWFIFDRINDSMHRTMVISSSLVLLSVALIFCFCILCQVDGFSRS